MKKLITVIFITLLCSCSASFNMGRQNAVPEISKAEIENMVKELNNVLGNFEKRLQALEPKKVEKK